MSNHPLFTYIHEARTRGMSNQDIIQALFAAGWQTHEILDILVGGAVQITPIPAASGDAIIAVHNAVKTYGTVRALDNVSLEVKRGGVTALLGPNGAGKTTLVRILTTLLAPDSGHIVVAGYNAVQQAQQLRGIIGLAGQYAAVDEMLTGRENLEMFARLYHFSSAAARQRAQDLLEQFDLTDAGDRPAKTYSGGMRRRLDLAASLVSKPAVLFLDEPTTGLDPRSRFALWHVIRDLVQQGTTVLLTTQYLEEADQLADKIFVIDHGRIIAQGTADELKRQVGGDILEVHVADHAEVDRAADILRPFGTDEPRPEADTGIITMAIDGGAAVLVDVVREADAAGLAIRDIVLRRPSLDDVFMKLTGHTTQ
ncbi:MAG TPA: ATP-binding cassette domain-containing protein [Candidatus Paceibacterota bacterium]|nr:ATP-binding cassette domain-containing protein [Candidatus Paceibacterota bacterium]